MLAIDTETTGLTIRNGCRPFYVSTCDDEGNIKSWRWDVDPTTRMPKVHARDRRSIQQLIDTHCNRWFREEDGEDIIVNRPIVMHNAKFDWLALESIGIHIPGWQYVNDTLVASHCIASSDSHGLKDLAIEYLDVGDEDQQALRDACNEARRIARSKFKDFDIARAHHPHFPAMKRAPKAGWWVLDMWLPRAVAKAQGLPKDHHFWNVLDTYANTDAERTIALWLVLREGLEAEELINHYEERRGLLEVTYGMEQHGIPINPSDVESVREEYNALAAKHTFKAKEHAAHNIDNLNSPKQLQGILFGHFKLKPVKETAGSKKARHQREEDKQWSTDNDSLLFLSAQVDTDSDAYGFIESLQLARKYSKAVDFLDTYEQSAIIGNDGASLLHTNFNITGTATTRFSSNNPNAQNISKREINLRRVFGPRPGREWFSIDYENIEFRIFAYGCEDQNLIDAFERGESMHLVIARQLHPKLFAKLGPDKFKKTKEYAFTKNGNFALIYGASQRKANATYRVPDAYNRIRKGLPKIDEFMQAKFEEAKTTGFVRTLGGYPLQVPEGKPHVAVNYYCQGSAGWAMVLAMNRVHAFLKPFEDHHVIMTIHDELDFDFPHRKGNVAKVRTIKKLMEQSGDDLGLPTPVDVDRITTNWAEGKAIAA